MSQYLKTAVKAAKKAERVIMNYYSRGVRAELKKDESPVTIADTEAEKMPVLARLFT
ncbi:hypothetical protein GF352_03295 [archaeon]|nr:hypothetical protein [archaeon]